MSKPSPYQIQINNKCAAEDTNQSLLIRRAVVETLRRFDIHRAELSVVLLSDREMADLHQRFLGRTGPTDVLTFDLATGPRDPPAAASIDGEVVISVDTARRCARKRGHSPAAEITLYVVHGVLHLLGLDDADEEAARRMHALEDEVLTAVGLGRVYASEKGKSSCRPSAVS